MITTVMPAFWAALEATGSKGAFAPGDQVLPTMLRKSFQETLWRGFASLCVRPFSVLRIDFQVAFVLSNEISANRQSETGSLPGSLRREERLENAGEIGFRNAFA